MSSAVLFVCLGNICRSPTAHGVFKRKLELAGLTHITVDSAGTGSWHVGEAPDGRATEVAERRGYELSDLRARQVCRGDFELYDYVLAMDGDNLAGLQRLAPESYKGYLGLFLDFHPDSSLQEVPDPYYGGDAGFENVLDMIEEASDGLLRHITA